MWPTVTCQQSQEHCHAHITQMSKIVFSLLVKFYGVLYCLFLPFAYVSLDFFSAIRWLPKQSVAFLSDDGHNSMRCMWWVSVYTEACRKHWKCLSCCSAFFLVHLATSIAKVRSSGTMSKFPNPGFDISDEACQSLWYPLPCLFEYVICYHAPQSSQKSLLRQLFYGPRVLQRATSARVHYTAAILMLIPRARGHAPWQPSGAQSWQASSQLIYWHVSSVHMYYFIK